MTGVTATGVLFATGVALASNLQRALLTSDTPAFFAAPVQHMFQSHPVASSWVCWSKGSHHRGANQSGVTIIGARHSKPKLQLNWRVTKIKCCESIFFKLPEVTEKRYFLLIWKKFTSRDIWFKRKTRTTTELARALRHAGARREAFRFVLKELRCPTCEARPLPLPPRPGMLPRCLRFNQCIGVDLVDLEVRYGTSAKALNVVCWGTGLQIVQPLWTNYTAKTVMKEFKIAWVKHYGWPEIIVHDQGPKFMGNEFQNSAGAAGVLTMPIDSKGPWQNGKTEGAGQSFKHQLWDLDEECRIEGETEFEAAVAECCDARNRYCNRSGFFCASTCVWL